MRTKTLLVLSWLALATFTSRAHAQVSDSLAAAAYEYYPRVSNGNGRGTISLNVFRTSVGVPFFVADRTTLIAAASYELIDVNSSRDPRFQLHQPKLTLGLTQGFSARWGAMLFVDAGFASDFSDELGADDVLLSLTAIGTFAVNDSLTFGAGFSYDRRTGSPAPLPAVLLNLRLTERSRIRGFVPAHLDAEYHTTEWLDLGLRATFEGNRFHLGKERFGETGIELAYSNLNVGPKITISLDDWVHLDLYAAGAVYRRYEIFEDDASRARYDLSPGLAYGARFWLGPSKWHDQNLGP